MEHDVDLAPVTQLVAGAGHGQPAERGAAEIKVRAAAGADLAGALVGDDDGDGATGADAGVEAPDSPRPRAPSSAPRPPASRNRTPRLRASNTQIHMCTIVQVKHGRQANARAESVELRTRHCGAVLSTLQYRPYKYTANRTQILAWLDQRLYWPESTRTLPQH
jgi:hypothetical protein